MKIKEPCEFGETFPYSASLGKIFGVKESIFLCKFIWWFKNETLSVDGWLNKSQREIYEATGLNEDEQRRITNKLVKRGILATHYMRETHKKYYCLNPAAIQGIVSLERQETTAKTQTLPKPRFDKRP